MQIANIQYVVPVGLTQGGDNDNEAPCGNATQPDFSRQNVDYRNYTVIDSGFDAQGNHYCTRVYHGPGATDEMIGYHYSDIDGSYSYKNPDGTTYYNDGRGGSRYTRTDGTGWEKKEFPTAGGGSFVTTATCNHQLPNLGSAASDVMLKISECLKGATASVKDAIDGGMEDTNEFVMVGQDEASRSKDGNPAIKKEDI